MKSELLHGTLEIMILKTLSWGPMHGYGIRGWIEQLSNGALQIEEGSLYPALYRMEQKELIASEWGLTENKRQAKFYRLTRKGRTEMLAESQSWERLSSAVSRVLKAIEQEG